MADHYYTAEPTSAHKPCQLRFDYRGEAAIFETDSGVFSRTEIDRGTEVMLSALPVEMSGSVLDMGCGYGVIGVSVGKKYPGCEIVMSDINSRACGLAEANARRNGVKARVVESDGYARLGDERYDYILQNPPIRAGKAVIYEMFRQAARRLNVGGSLWLVIRRQQGAASALSFLQTLYHEAAAVEKESGFWVLRCALPKEKTEGAGKEKTEGAGADALQS